MTIIKSSTKKGNALLQTARNNQGYYLWQVYGTYSRAKESAWEWCRELCISENGENFRIISHNSNVFSVAWESNCFDGNTVVPGIRIETRHNSYFIPNE